MVSEGEPPELVLAGRFPCAPVRESDITPAILGLEGDHRVFDLFPFNSECDVLEIRMHELYDVVTFFVIAELTVSEQGTPKHLTFLSPLCRARWSFAAAKVVYVTGNESDAYDIPDDAWKYYKLSYAVAWRALTTRFTLEPDDVVVTGDLDELVSANSVREAVRAAETRKYVVNSTFFMYTFKQCFASDWPPNNLVQNRRNFRFPVVTRASELMPHNNPLALFDMRELAYHQVQTFGILPQGAHVSWRVGIPELYLKMRSNTEQKGVPLNSLHELSATPTLDHVHRFLTDIVVRNGQEFKPDHAPRFYACDEANLWRPAWYLRNTKRFMF